MPDVITGVTSIVWNINHGCVDALVFVLGLRVIKSNLHPDASMHSQELNLAKNHIGVEGARKLSLGLTASRSLTSVNLNWCKLKAEGVAHVAAALATNTNIRELNLARWDL